MLAIAASLTIASPSPVPATQQARASAIIVKGVRADAREWRENPPRNRREIIRVENGQKIHLRVIDHE